MICGSGPVPGAHAGFVIGLLGPASFRHIVAGPRVWYKGLVAKKRKRLPEGTNPLADVDDLTADVGFKPQTPITSGIQKFVEWYRQYYK